MKQIAILKPRLDVSFKPGPVPEQRGPIVPIRVHWDNFVKKLAQQHIAAGDAVNLIERPLWHFDVGLVTEVAANHDVVYIPHKQKFEYPYVENAMYYMQTNFPDRFTVDQNGWGAYLSFLPVIGTEANEDLWQALKARVNNNVSKFDQPKRAWDKKGYWLFVCQIPHDQVIQQSSKISVADALKETIKLAKEKGKKLIVKGHPVNPGAMFELRAICLSNGIDYVDDISIHDALKNSEAVFLVNSGVGFEAMIHEKPVVSFGESEYSNVVNRFSGKDTVLNMDTNQYKLFMSEYFKHLFYTGD